MAKGLLQQAGTASFKRNSKPLRANFHCKNNSVESISSHKSSFIDPISVSLEIKTFKNILIVKSKEPAESKFKSLVKS